MPVVLPQQQSTPILDLNHLKGDCSSTAFTRGTLTGELCDRIIAKGSRFDHLVLENAIFKEHVDFSESVFEGGLTLRNVSFLKDVNFSQCRFDGPVSATQLTCKTGANFYRTEFSDRAFFRANFQGDVNFTESIFRDGATFTGWRNISATARSGSAATSFGIATVSGQTPSFADRLVHRLRAIESSTIELSRRAALFLKEALTRTAKQISTIRRRFAITDERVEQFEVFSKGAEFSSVSFLRPDQTVFSEADLSNVYFRGTNLRGVRLSGARFWQPRLKRNGLRDEIFVHFSGDGPFRHREMALLEDTCRNARVALEENRNFAAATDFYVGEMEAARAQLRLLQRHIFSVPALYFAASRYGSSVAVAVRGVLLLILLHICATLWLIDLRPDQIGGHIQEVVFRSAKILMFQSADLLPMHRSDLQAWLDLLFKVLVPAQLAMVIFAFRSRIKRH